jgi:uncharacterized protein (DUF58 family)
MAEHNSDKLIVNMLPFDKLVQQTVLNSMKLKEYFRMNLIYYQLVSGKGLEFDRLKEYYVGGDPKRIDWKKFAKDGKLLLRVFKEERHFDIIIVMDVSDTMLLGTTDVTKNEYAAIIAGVFANAAIEAEDNVALVMHSDQHEVYLDPTAELFSLMNVMSDPTNYGGIKDWPKLTQNLVLNYRQESIIFIISDFIDTDPEMFLPELAANFSKVYGIMVRDPVDNALPKGVGKMYITAPNGKEKYLVDFNKVREEYEILVNRDITRIRESFRQYNQLFFQIIPGEDFGKEFIKSLGGEEVIIT